MQLQRLKLTAAFAMAGLVLVGSLVVTPAAGAAITATSITTPADPSFFIADNDAASQTFAISGTTTGGTVGDHVDVNCYRGSQVATVAANVAVTSDGSFSVPSADMNGVFGQDAVCQLRAVPAGTTPSDLTPFAGPWVGVGERDSSKVSGGPNDGTVDDYYLYDQQRTAATDYLSLGSCGLDEGYLFDSTGALTAGTWWCNAFATWENPSGTRSDLQIDGANAYTPASAEQGGLGGSSGYPALTYTYSVDPHTGNLVINETDPLVKCTDPTFPPTTTSCPTLVSTGVTDQRTITTDHDGHVSWITDVFSSTDGQAHTIDLLWENDEHFHTTNGDATQLEYEFPGESSYAMHVLGDTVSLPNSPGTIFVRMHGAADGDHATGQGALVYDRAATSATFGRVNSDYEDFLLDQAVTVSANGSTRLRFAYIQDYQSATVASLAQAASTAFLNPVTVTKAGTGSGTVTSSPAGVNCGSTCSYGYPYGTSVTLTATPATGSSFAGWSGACTGTGTCMVTTNDTTAVTATFTLIPETLTVSKTGDGKGTVTSSPTGISCGATCSVAFPYGTSVTLTPSASSTSRFHGWSGACTGTGACTVPMTAASSVSASFLRDCVVPNVKGKTPKKAKAALKHADCRVGKITKATSAEVKKGHVISQRPKAHKKLAHGAKVNLVVSKGKPQN
jgi:hypothetical protein